MTIVGVVEEASNSLWIKAVLDPTLPLDRVETYAGFIRESLTGMFYVAAIKCGCKDLLNFEFLRSLS
jgi:hypothetical protein